MYYEYLNRIEGEINRYCIQYNKSSDHQIELSVFIEILRGIIFPQNDPLGLIRSYNYWAGNYGFTMKHGHYYELLRTIIFVLSDRNRLVSSYYCECLKLFQYLFQGLPQQMFKCDKTDIINNLDILAEKFIRGNTIAQTEQEFMIRMNYGLLFKESFLEAANDLPQGLNRIFDFKKLVAERIIYNLEFNPKYKDLAIDPSTIL